MRVLFDMTHPAHLLLFRHVMDRLQREGHRVRVTGREKDVLVDLADAYGIDMEVFGVSREGVANKGWEMLQRQVRLLQTIRRFKPDVIMAAGGPYVGLLGRLAGVPVHIFCDMEHDTLCHLLAHPFATCVYVPRCYHKPMRWRHHRYNGYHALAYLRPKYFTPDLRVLGEVGLDEGELFSIVRFVDWGAVHDIGREGFTRESKLLAVERLRRHGRVFILCEGELPVELEEHRLHLGVARVHDLMAYAALVFGESATMCSEGAVLGVPGVYLDPVGRGYTDELEREYGLVFNFTPDRQREAIARGDEILADYQRDHWRAKGRRLVEEKIDVTEMLYRVATERSFARNAGTQPS